MENRLLVLWSQGVNWQCTDSSNSRFTALHETVNAVHENDEWMMAIMGYSNQVRTGEFTDDPDAFAEFLDPAQGVGPGRDLQGALAKTAEMLSQQDCNDDIAYSYQLVVIETSAPSPICSRNCVEESDDAGFECDPQFSDCDSTDTAGVYNVKPEEIPDGHYIDFEGPCTPYNQPETLAARLEDIREAVPRVSIHFLLANDDVDTIEAVCPGVEEVLEIDEAAALYERLLQGFDDDSSLIRLMPGEIDIPDCSESEHAELSGFQGGLLVIIGWRTRA